ncbi:MAG: TIGR04442 family protein [Desulfobacteraceae bacterium 4572_35.1]|nr:MAG: TIGR04442 family protein [Desulfobacteraceae bacterium 4572_35.1]
MQQELRLHGHIDDTVEYFVTVAAHDAENCHFYERDGDALRIFSPGNEMRLGSSGLTHWGNGGSFCEYMYGIDQPLADLIKPEVKNRLVLFGAGYKDGGELVFSDDTMGTISYETIFAEGHAIANCFFFVTGSIYGALKTQQEGLLLLLGRLLKRTPRVGDADDASLVDELAGLLGHKSHFYLIRLINKKHKAYYDLFQKLYFTYRNIPDSAYENLQVLAQRLGIGALQQQRIRIAVMYAHRDNRPVVDEYRDILIACHHDGTITRAENARLTRLKTLATRNKIPAKLFAPLDDNLKYEKMVDQEQDYIADTREILSSLLSRNQSLDQAINRDDMLRLLFAKRRAMHNRDYLFDQILLETSKVCDEQVHRGADVALLERMNTIIEYFDHYENSATEINNLAFMVGVRIDEHMIYAIQRSFKALERLEKNLFNQLLFDDLLVNRFMGVYGRRKIVALQHGLHAGHDMAKILMRLRHVSSDEATYGQLLTIVQELLKNKYSQTLNWECRVMFRRDVEARLQLQGISYDPFPDQIFCEVMINVEKELFYLQQLLPKIIAEKHYNLRDDFLLNSGLDRFYIEELEHEYLLRHGLEGLTLEQVGIDN